MRFLPLKVRPRSTHTVYDFGGIWHNLETPSGGLSLSGSAHHWYDERNLSHDAAPAMSTRGGRPKVARVAGMIIPHKMIASECTGAHPVILDEAGWLYCNGHAINTIGDDPTQEQIEYHWKMTPDENTGGDVNLSIYPLSGSSTDPAALGGLVSVEDDVVWFTYTAQGGPASDASWYLNRSGASPVAVVSTYASVGGCDQWTFTDYGITIAADNALDEDWRLTVRLWSVDSYAEGTYLVRMGANVIIMPGGIMVNVAKLEAGESVTPEPTQAEFKVGLGLTMDIVPCLLDGTVLSPVAGTAAPNDITKIWADTTGEKTVMRQYVSATVTWEAMQQVYVKIVTNAHFISGDRALRDRLRQWDAVELSNDGFDDDGAGYSARALQEAEEILSGSAVLYGCTYDENTGKYTLIIPGILSQAMTGLYPEGVDGVKILRQMPKMDFIVECGNRLWGCYYGPDGEGNILNEIYASKLGDPRNWRCYMGLSTDSWVASRGRNAPYTGAAVLDNSPLFFREQSLEKVYPSSSGAHQIQTFDLDGVEAGAHNTMVVIEEKLYYKHPRGIMCYTGTIPQLISRAFGDVRYKGVTACRYKYRYLICMRDYEIDADHPNGHLLLGVYDIPSGEWHIETNGWDGTTVAMQDVVWYSQYRAAQGLTPAGYENHQYNVGYLGSAAGDENSSWMAETGIIGYELPEHRFISCVRIRIELRASSVFKAHIQYDDSGTWLQKTSITAGANMPLNTREINIYPLRCDHFRLKLEGVGPCKIVSISYRMERSEGGH